MICLWLIRKDQHIIYQRVEIMLIRNGKGIIALGDFRITEGDKVVVCCLPKAIPRIEKLFL